MIRQVKSVYYWPLSVAIRAGEKELWQESYNENIECKKFIEETIRNNFDGLNLKPVAKQVIDEFGYHRTEFVLANTLKCKQYDGRFSKENETWGMHTFVPKERNNMNFDYAVDSHPTLLDSVVSEYRHLHSTLDLIDSTHCVEKTSEQDFEGKVIAIAPTHLSVNHLTKQDQLWLCTGGFGARPNARGNAVFATCLSDGERARWERYQVLGVVKDEHIPEWATEKLAELQKKDEPTQEIGGMNGMSM